MQFVAYDLLPVLMPNAFVVGAAGLHQAWLNVVTDSDGVICISKAVADELNNWRKTGLSGHRRTLDIGWFHLGSDLQASVPTNGLPVSAIAILKTIKESHAFLMIGTLEPRKGHAQVVTAFEQLWSRGVDVLLVIVGKPGWLVEPLIAKLRSHQEFGKKLIWLESITDEYLEEIYKVSTCLIAASLGEGFGLPLIEAAHHKLPIIARDIPVFREVAGEHACYFSGNQPQALANVLVDWLHRHELGQHPRSDTIPWLTWEQSADQLLKLVLQERIKPRLAFVSPLQPERTGIANYSGELLPVLKEYFEIELITDQAEVDLPSSLADLPIRSVDWFDAHAQGFDRILYQIGNSPFHSHMLGLLHRHPGAVMLHDFFLSGLLEYCELAGIAPGIWARSLYVSHGYHAMLDRFSADGPAHARYTYPCNLEVLQTAKGVIVHSLHSQRLAREWYGAHAADYWYVIPHLRRPATNIDRTAARRMLGIAENAFLVCSFGFVAPTKLSHRLLDAWLSSRLCVSSRCQLVLVGTNEGENYGEGMSQRIRDKRVWRPHSDHRLGRYGHISIVSSSGQCRCAVTHHVARRNLGRGSRLPELRSADDYQRPWFDGRHP